VLSLLTFIAGCGARDLPTSDVDVPPYSSDKFSDVLDQSVLQYTVASTPFSNEVFSGTKEDEKLVQFSNEDYFFLDNEEHMVFSLSRNQDAPPTRIELRQAAGEWSTSDKHIMQATLQLSDTEASEYTWMQLHRKSDQSVRPPLRLVWMNRKALNGRVFVDYLFAVFYQPAAEDMQGYNNSYKLVPLQARSDEYIDVELTAEQDWVSISIEGVVLHEENVSQWAAHKSYFKTGIYLSGGQNDAGQNAAGIVEVRFDALEYVHSPALRNTRYSQ